MSVGFIMLVHTALDRAAQVARHLSASGSPVVIHIDRRVPDVEAQRFRSILRSRERVVFCERFRCEWGTWSIVQATLAATDQMLRDFSEVSHVYLASGSCMPLRPVRDLQSYLSDRTDTDFVESVTTRDARWTHGGLDEERFTLYFPVPWRKRRGLFDGLVNVQRKLGIRRKTPEGLHPHLGSQWWCLTRSTLQKILNDPRRNEYDSYFSKTWIPDESYFQTLARVHSSRLEGRSLTLSKFDTRGRPYTFYDDHLELLRRSDCFFARKIWPKADRIYQNFLGHSAAQSRTAEPDPGKIDRLFSSAIDLRTRGRPGLVMQSRFPRDKASRNETAEPYTVVQGLDHVFEDFSPWFQKVTGAAAHGHLFDPEGAQFSGHQTISRGGVTANPYLRDYDRESFLRNVIWNSRGQHQMFCYGPEDGVKAWEIISHDPNARILMVTGSWAIKAMQASVDFDEARNMAAQLQRTEDKQVEILKGPQMRAKVQVLTLSDYLANPMAPLQAAIAETGTNARFIGEAPRMTNLDRLGKFLQQLRNSGMNPYLAGHFAPESLRDRADVPASQNNLAL